MSGIDISPEAVEAWIATHGLSHAMRDNVRALSEALEQSRAETAGVTHSRDHFKQRAGSQKDRVAKLRHRQRALLSALEAIQSATSLNDAKFKANIAIGGWSDDNLIFDARSRPTPDQTAALDTIRAEARAQGMREAAELCANDAEFARKKLGASETREEAANWALVVTRCDFHEEIILAAITKGAKA